MLSYQHGYHAGGPADLHKHIVLAELLARLTAKPRAIGYFETHAGRGLYDLAAPEALKTGEAAQGIARIAVDPATLFGRALAAVRARYGPAAYPGSPLLARELLRPQDRLTLFELHPAEHAALAAGLGRAPGTAIDRRDGFAGVLARVPPATRRGLVLVDPSYEVKDEYAATAAFVRDLAAKWPEATVLVWYPLLPAGRHRMLLAGLAPLRPAVDEVRFEPPPARGMTGSGLALVGAPHGAAAMAFAAAHKQAAPVLAPA
ncbi:MAG: 23S rRNA (adenine(2030)-N(6))-methyltransferase RlmJ [Amaricoccus sp.]